MAVGIGCLICNLAVGHALNWFFIVLTSLMVFASITVVPLLVNNKKILWTICSFTISLVALLGTICIYSGGKWFYLAVIPCVAGLVICFAPFLIRYISLPKGVCNHKALITMSVESLAVYSIIAVVGIYSKYPGYWAAAIPITTYCLLVPWGIVLVLRYLPVSKMFRASIACLVSSLLLTFVNDVVDWSIGDFNGICLATKSVLACAIYHSFINSIGAVYNWNDLFDAYPKTNAMMLYFGIVFIAAVIIWVIYDRKEKARIT